MSGLVSWGGNLDRRCHRKRGTRSRQQAKCRGKHKHWVNLLSDQQEVGQAPQSAEHLGCLESGMLVGMFLLLVTLGPNKVSRGECCRLPLALDPSKELLVPQQQTQWDDQQGQEDQWGPLDWYAA